MTGVQTCSSDLAGLGTTIEANQYAPGALIDNLTSFGAVPGNFVDPAAGGQQSQVSVCRWLRAGATGVHGTVDEPLSNCFPSRQFLADYRAGATLAEAYGRNLPYVYWKNLVIGDPMTAPYATRPRIDLRCGDQLLDASVRGRLERLRTQLVTGSRSAH